MKRAIALFMACSMLTACLAAGAISVNAEEIVPGVTEENTSTEVERAGKLLSQFVAAQKESGDPLFRDSFVQYNYVDTPDHKLQKKVLVECYFEDTEAVLAVIRPFMEENGINEDLVVMDCLDVKDLQVIQDALDALIAQNGYDACTVIEDGSKVLVQFNPVPAGEEALDRDAIRIVIMDYCREHHLSTYLVKVEFLDQETPERQRACELLSQFIAEQKESGDTIKNHSYVEIGLFESPNRELETKVLVWCYTVDEEAALAVIKAFMQENEINEDLVQILYETPVYEGTPEDRELAENIRAFLLEQGYKVHIQYIEEELSGFEGKTIGVTFPSTPIGVELDRKAIKQMIEDYCTEQQLDYSKLLIGFNEAQSLVEPAPGEESSSQEEPAEDEPAAVSQAEPAEDEPAAVSQEEPAEETPESVPPKESVGEEPGTDSQTDTTGDDAPTTEPSSAETGSSAAELPQTGYFGFERIIAGLAALMTAAGTAIVVKTRKNKD